MGGAAELGEAVRAPRHEGPSLGHGDGPRVARDAPQALWPSPLGRARCPADREGRRVDGPGADPEEPRRVGVLGDVGPAVAGGGLAMVLSMYIYIWNIWNTISPRRTTTHQPLNGSQT